MKFLDFVTHPALLIFSFLFILISGEAWGGFYIQYILFALPRGIIHAVVAVVGIAIILLGNYKLIEQLAFWIKPILNICGASMLALSLYIFFYRDRNHYNYPTFYQTVPLILLTIFLLLFISFLVKNIIKLKQHTAT